jgi:hypothetical protein
VRTPRPAPPVLVHGRVEGHTRRWLARETVPVELPFLLPAVITAVDQHTAHRGPSRMVISAGLYNVSMRCDQIL